MEISTRVWRRRLRSAPIAIPTWSHCCSPKDLPIIARTVGRLAGRAIGYVQLARGQFDNIMQQNQARQVHKELQDTMAQLEAIRHEIRLVDNIDQTSISSDNAEQAKPDAIQHPDIEKRPNISDAKNFMPASLGFSNIESQATDYAKLAKSAALNSGLTKTIEVIDELTDESGLMVLPESAESTGLLPDRKDNAEGSDIVLEPILEAEVARNAKEFFVQHQNQMESG